MRLDVYPFISFRLFRNVCMHDFIIRVPRHVFVCMRVCVCVDEGPSESRAGLRFAERLPSCPVG